MAPTMAAHDATVTPALRRCVATAATWTATTVAPSSYTCHPWSAARWVSMAPTTAAQGATVTPALRRCVATAAGAAFSGVAVQHDRLAGDGGVGEADRAHRDAASAPESEETGNVVEGREGTVKPDLVRVPQRALDDPQVHPVHGLVGSFPDPRTVPVPQLSSAQIEQGQEVGVGLGSAGEIGALIPAGLEVLAAAVSEVVEELAAASAVCSLQRAYIEALQSITEIRLVISSRKSKRWTSNGTSKVLLLITIIIKSQKRDNCTPNQEKSVRQMTVQQRKLTMPLSHACSAAAFLSALPVLHFPGALSISLIAYIRTCMYAVPFLMPCSLPRMP